MRYLLKTLPSIYGADPEGEEEEESTSTGEGEETSTSEEEQEENEEEDDDTPEALLSALRKERSARAKAEKEAKALRKFKEDWEEENQSELEKAQKRADEAEAQAEQAANDLRETRLNGLITKYANKAKFRDSDDAILWVDRDEIETDDDGVPDEKSVEKAVKAVAKSKDYLIDTGSDGASKSGSKFGGGKKESGTSQEALEKKYPSLRNRS